MNNFTKTESLPKTGHVTEVCKEWLVREDSALAYKLQSQEINDFYKGNRFRNAVVREDFPTALHEQIKEREHADKQVEMYRRRLVEQEEHDKRVAKEIADKLERDLQEQQQQELHESELIAQQMQQIYVNLPPVPPPGARDRSKPPPRPAKASTLNSPQHPVNSTQLIVGHEEPSTSNGRYRNHPQPHTHHHQSHHHQQQHYHHHHPQQQHTPEDEEEELALGDGCYVSVSLTPQNGGGAAVVVDEAPPHARQKHQPTNGNHLLQQSHRHPSVGSPSSSSSSSSSSASASTAGQGLGASSAAGRRNVFESFNTAHSPTHALPPRPQTHCTNINTNINTTTTTTNTNSTIISTPNSTTHKSTLTVTPRDLELEVDEYIEYSEVADSVRRYDNNNPTSIAMHSSITTTTATATSSSSVLFDAADSSFSSTTSSSFSSNTNNNNNTTTTQLPTTPIVLSPSNENLLRNDHKFQKLSPEKYDQLVGNGGVGVGVGGALAAERHMQAHADDIELYVDPCEYTSLQEIGLPMHELKEISKKLKQEQKDELLARRLQEMEAHDGLTLEERDRLMAIEAQDKELAKMLQEREKVKAKRAKEKARLRKSQPKEPSSSASATVASCANGLNCGQLLPHDCLSGATSPKHIASSPSPTATLSSAGYPPDEPLDMEAYSNPIDVLHNSQQQRVHNGTLTNGSLTRDLGRHAASQQQQQQQQQQQHQQYQQQHLGRDDEDIYTLPVDSCRPGQQQRPASLNIGPSDAAAVAAGHHNSMTRSENYSIDSHDALNGHHEISPRLASTYTKAAGSFDKSSSPTPPYMPIQGTRRSNSSEDRKKKSKDKCTHQ